MKSNRTIHNLFVPLFLLLFSIAAFATDYGEISVNVESVTIGRDRDGYHEYRATIVNRSPAKSHRVTVALFAANYGTQIDEARRTVELAPLSSATIALFKPPALAGDGAAVTIDGERQREAAMIDLSRTNTRVSRSQNLFHLLVSREIEKSALMSAEAVEQGFKNAKGENDVAYLAYEAPPAEWSENWIGYSSFDGVLLSADELRAMPEGARSALMRYVESGGLLLVVGQWTAPPEWQTRRALLNADGSSESGAREARLPAGQGVRSWHIGFGLAYATNAVDPKLMTREQWARIKADLEQSRPGEKNYYQLNALNNDFPVADRLGIPVRGLFALMLGFVILIGPINLFWLARRGRKLWLLWTVPAISLLTCLAVAAFALFGEGFSATVRTEAFTILDETSHRATTVGWTAFYTPVAPAEGLHFSYDTELMPQWPGYWRYGGNDGAFRAIDLSNDQHLASGWVAARVPSFFKLRKNEMRRERLTIRQLTKDSISVVNGLGVDLQKLWVAGSDGRIYAAQDVKAGARADLSFFNLQAGGDRGALRAFFGDTDWLARMKLVEQDVTQYLMPGCYLAVTETSPFVEEALSNVQTRKGRSIIYGISAEAER
jgi:hypothetical protein